MNPKILLDEDIQLQLAFSLRRRGVEQTKMDTTIIILNIMAIGAGMSTMLWTIAKFRKEWYAGIKIYLDNIKKVTQENSTNSDFKPEAKETNNLNVKIFTTICLLVIAFSIWGLFKLLEQSNPVTTETVLYISLIISMNFFIIVILFLIFLFRSFSFYIHGQIAEQTSLSNWLKKLEQVKR